MDDREEGVVSDCLNTEGKKKEGVRDRERRGTKKCCMMNRATVALLNLMASVLKLEMVWIRPKQGEARLHPLTLLQ